MCLLCGYRMKLDVPAVLQRKMDERIRHEILWRKFDMKAVIIGNTNLGYSWFVQTFTQGLMLNGVDRTYRL
jgi:hypothetical protein